MTARDPVVDRCFEMMLKYLDAGDDLQTAYRRVERYYGDYAIGAQLVEARSIISAEIARIEQSSIVTSTDETPWFVRSLRHQPDSHIYYRSLRDRLRVPVSALPRIDAESEIIVNHLDRPDGEITTRGLVMGYVQSGKTTNFSAVIASAFDGGYRAAIVLAGTKNNLRRQTQRRLEYDFGELVEDNRVFFVTTPEADFGDIGGITRDNLTQKPWIIVVKKNTSRLRRLSRWLETPGPDRDTRAVLLIDDEVDEASVSRITARSRNIINKQIRRILRHDKIAYAGYTATPYANVFGPSASDADDLFPRSFIYSLEEPDGYFGPEQLFGKADLPEEEGSGGMDVIRPVGADEAHALKHDEDRLTPGLEAAIEYFLLATAERIRRAGGKLTFHSSMLIHTSFLTADHEKLAARVSPIVESIRLDVQREDPVRQRRLRDLWHREDVGLQGVESIERGTFEELSPYLGTVLAQLSLRIENAQYEGVEYPEDGPWNVAILVGGNKLARGFTVGGLVCSYFLRTGNAMDTLVQMGRWFGFRPGYADLPRIWTTDDLRYQFSTFAAMEQSLRRRIEQMGSNKQTPMEARIAVMRDPSWLILSHKVDSAQKVRLQYSNKTLLNYSTRARDLKKNLEAVKALIRESASSGAEIAQPEGWEGAWLLEDVPARTVLEFFRGYAFPEDTGEIFPNVLEDYCRSDLSRDWTIGVVGPKSDQMGYGAVDLHLPKEVIKSGRYPAEGPTDAGWMYIQGITSPPDRWIDTYPSRADADREVKSGRVSGSVERDPGKPPLMLIYPISERSRPKSGDGQPLGLAEPVMGLYFDMPGTADASVELIQVANSWRDPSVTDEQREEEEEADHFADEGGDPVD